MTFSLQPMMVSQISIIKELSIVQIVTSQNGEPSLGMSLFVNKYICTGNNNLLLILSNVYIEDKQCYIQE